MPDHCNLKRIDCLQEAPERVGQVLATWSNPVQGATGSRLQWFDLGQQVQPQATRKLRSTRAADGDGYYPSCIVHHSSKS